VPVQLGGGAICEFTAWPEFHNGVATGLRMASGGHQLTRTWIVYNKPPEPSYAHAGVLFALGLMGKCTVTPLELPLTRCMVVKASML
jgi:hypothetical protein